MLTTEPHFEFIWLELPIVPDSTEKIEETTPKGTAYIRADQIVGIEQAVDDENLCRVDLEYDESYRVAKPAQTVRDWLAQGVQVARQQVERPESPADDKPETK